MGGLLEALPYLCHEAIKTLPLQGGLPAATRSLAFEVQRYCSFEAAKGHLWTPAGIVGIWAVPSP